MMWKHLCWSDGSRRYICVHVCIYIYVCTYMYIYTRACCGSTCVGGAVSRGIYMCMYVYVYVCICICMHICICVYIYIYT